MAGYVSLFDLGESRDDVEVDYNSLHHYRVNIFTSNPFSPNILMLISFCTQPPEWLWSKYARHSEAERGKMSIDVICFFAAFT